MLKQTIEKRQMCIAQSGCHCLAIACCLPEAMLRNTIRNRVQHRELRCLLQIDKDWFTHFGDYLGKVSLISDSSSGATKKVNYLDKRPWNFRGFENKLAFTRNTSNRRWFANGWLPMTLKKRAFFYDFFARDGVSNGIAERPETQCKEGAFAQPLRLNHTKRRLQSPQVDKFGLCLSRWCRKKMALFFLVAPKTTTEK